MRPDEGTRRTDVRPRDHGSCPQRSSERCLRTVDEPEAEPGQRVFGQKVVFVLVVTSVLNSPPGRHRSAEHQIVTGAGATQILFSLKIQNITWRESHDLVDPGEILGSDWLWITHTHTRVHFLLSYLFTRHFSYSKQNPTAALTFLTSALFCRLLWKGSRVRQAATDNMGRTHLNMAPRTSTFPSRGSHDIDATRSPKGVRLSVLSRTPAGGHSSHGDSLHRARK